MARHRLVALGAVLEQLARLAPPSRRDLLRGMLAEFEALSDPADRSRFAIGAVWAIARLAVAGWMSGWMPAAHVWLTGLGAGALVAMLDPHTASACVLAPLLTAASLLCGSLAPREAWRGAAAILGGLIAAAAWVLPPGVLDRADLLSLCPLVIIAVHAGAVARRLVPATPRVGANAS